ncbi:MAG: PqqD family protein [Anaerolineae bacterium]
METELTLASICSPSEDVVARVIEEELIIVPLAAGIGDMEGELYSMNETGKAIWDSLDGKRSLGQIAADLAAEYDAPAAEIEADILGVVSELARRKMLVIR